MKFLKKTQKKKNQKKKNSNSSKIKLIGKIKTQPRKKKYNVYLNIKRSIFLKSHLWKKSTNSCKVETTEEGTTEPSQ